MTQTLPMAGAYRANQFGRAFQERLSRQSQHALSGLWT